MMAPSGNSLGMFSTSRFRVALCLIGSIFGFALIPIFIRYFADTLDAWTVNGVRYSVGAIFWLPFLLLLDRNPTTTGMTHSNATRRNVWIDAIVPSLANIMAQVGFGLAPYYVTASAIGFVMRLSFLFAIVFGFLFLAEERLLARKKAFWIGTAISIFGVIAMYSGKLNGNSNSVTGMLIILWASIGMGAYTVAVRYCMASYSARESFSVISLYTSIALVAIMFCFGDYGRLAHISLNFWLLLMLSALIGIAFSHVLLYQAIHHFGPIVASGAQLVTPFITYLMAVVFLGERMSLAEWLGGSLLILGGALLVLAKLQAEKSLATHTACSP
jgi:drug/metabolite transporter (DMT)-like permease